MADEKKRDDIAIDMGDRKGAFDNPRRSPGPQQAQTPIPNVANVANNPVFPVLSYCASSILMTVTNKFVLSGTGFNLNFFLLCVQVPHASFLESNISRLTWLLVSRLCCCLRDMQVVQDYHISRLQFR